MRKHLNLFTVAEEAGEVVGMGLFEDLLTAPLDFVNSLIRGVEIASGTDIPILDKAPSTVDDEPTDRQIAKARRDLAIMLAAPFLLVPAVPAAYALYKGRKRPSKRRTAESEERIGVALENASNASSTLIQTALAAPVVAAAYTYIAVQKAETGKLISKGLGDAVQTLLAAGAVAPAIGGIIGGIAKVAK